MTEPANPNDKPGQENKDERDLLLVIVMAALLIGVVSGVVRRNLKIVDLKAAWNLTSVVVVTEDMPAGTIMMFEHLAKRLVPRQIVTSQQVTEGDVGVVNGEKLLVDLAQGQVLSWHDLAAFRNPNGCEQACAELRADGAKDAERVNERIRQIREPRP